MHISKCQNRSTFTCIQYINVQQILCKIHHARRFLTLWVIVIYQKKDGCTWPFFWYDTNFSKKEKNFQKNRCHTKRRPGAATHARPSFRMTKTQGIRDLFAWRHVIILTGTLRSISEFFDNFFGDVCFHFSIRDTFLWLFTHFLVLAQETKKSKYFE